MVLPSERRRDETLNLSLYLRTGRRAIAASLEFKFNHNHDPHDGRFTFASGGGTQGAQGGRSAGQPRATRSVSDPKNPRNSGVHVVKPGDTLSKIAATRKGLRTSDLAWVNGISENAPLQVGQEVRVPNQEFLDAGREAKNRAVALAYYMDTHDQRLPPDVAHPPSLETQILGPSQWHHEIANGYDYGIDATGRMRAVTGTLASNPDQVRSRRSQTEAGGADRLPTDQGGHYIARRFDGPTEAFNHFAQDANFNRGDYRALENKWAQAEQGHQSVWVKIVPIYVGLSRRPDSIRVTYRIGAAQLQRDFSNHPRKRS